ncbi:ribbon-helix-helix domain-containing protein [Amylibacter sp. SFDW26]|uniref:ribbon-helix-helix domain-containing protein n=1 Tax=Amylibacter sp. SFDW26 TaxID=2652722 RepID=UPI0012622C9D|nr:ribbon-helix-helix domain-containing protein [Amylibacter sp. SFDW26]KAB7616046.1 ribbon-helix-helix domain-containing protein [Amylibacter sp. SFDW26]
MIDTLISELDLGRPQKHSLTLRGHRTSVSLEDPYWLAFVKIAQRENTPINELAAKIDAARLVDAGLASAIRIFVLRWYQYHAK